MTFNEMVELLGLPEQEDAPLWVWEVPIDIEDCLA